MKRCLSWILSIAILCSSLFMFTGCSKSKDIITLTIYNENIDEPGYLTGWYADLIRDKFKIQIQYVSVSDLGFGAYVAQNDLADIIIFSTNKHFRIARDAGTLLDWSAHDFLSDFAPDLSKSQALSLKKNQLENGSASIYGIYANVSENDDIYTLPACIYLKTDYYEALESPTIHDWDDLKAIISQMTELAKTSTEQIYGFSSSNAGDDVMLSFLTDSVALYGYEPFGFGIYNAATNDYQDVLDSDGLYIELLEVYNSWYQDGLIDSASSTQTMAELQKKYDKGQVMMSFQPQSGFTPVPLECATPNRYQQDPAGNGSIFSISANSKYPDYALRLIEWFYSEEGYLTNCYGPKGVTWDYDANGNPQITELGATLIADPTLNLSDYHCGFDGRVIDGISHLNTNTWDMRSTMPGHSDITFDSSTWKGSLETARSPLEDFNAKYVPANGFIMEDMITEQRIPYTQVAAVVNSYSWYIIYSKTEDDLSSYKNGMISQAKAYRYDLPDQFYKEQLAKYRSCLGY